LPKSEPPFLSIIGFEVLFLFLLWNWYLNNIIRMTITIADDIVNPTITTIVLEAEWFSTDPDRQNLSIGIGLADENGVGSADSTIEALDIFVLLFIPGDEDSYDINTSACFIYKPLGPPLLFHLPGSYVSSWPAPTGYIGGYMSRWPTKFTPSYKEAYLTILLQ
jgi:hypothetical protein